MRPTLLLLMIAAAACAPTAQDRWQNQGAARYVFETDDGECQAMTATTKAYRACMTARGWRKRVW